jgi:hypothetical protein
MPQTKLEVWNLAIDIIKDTALQSDTDSSATARWLDRNWEHTIETTLRSYTWNFAKLYAELPAETDAPAHTWNRAFKMPGNALRLLPPRRFGQRYGRPIAHEIVGRYIYTNESAPLRVTFIMNEQDPSKWDPLFTEIVRCKLALGMANKFTSKNKFIELASQLLKTAQDKAEEIDTLEGSPEPIEQFDILRVRGLDADDDGPYY